MPMAASIPAVYDGLEEENLEQAMEIAGQQFVALRASADMAEGLAAFLEKRRPRFQDR